MDEHHRGDFAISAPEVVLAAIASQAVKDLGILTRQWEQRLKQPNAWNGHWEHDGMMVRRRLRIVMGHGMSHSAFEAERRRPRPKPSVLQLINLLQSDGRIYLTWQELTEDLSKIPGWEELVNLLRSHYPASSEAKLRNHAGQTSAFVQRMSPGDWAVIPPPA